MSAFKFSSDRRAHLLCIELFTLDFATFEHVLRATLSPAEFQQDWPTFADGDTFPYPTLRRLNTGTLAKSLVIGNSTTYGLSGTANTINNPSLPASKAELVRNGKRAAVIKPIEDYLCTWYKRIGSINFKRPRKI